MLLCPLPNMVPRLIVTQSCMVNCEMHGAEGQQESSGKYRLNPPDYLATSTKKLLQGMH